MTATVRNFGGTHGFSSRTAMQKAHCTIRGVFLKIRLLALVLMVCAPSWVKGSGDASTPSYTTQIAPIFQQSCLACHSATTKMGGLVLENYEGLMKGGIHDDVITPGKAEESRMIQMLEGKVQPRMPFGGDPLPPAAIATIKAWIDAGARGPAPGEVTTPLVPLAPLAIPDFKPQVPAASPVGSLRFSPDGKLLAVGAYKQVRLMDPATGKAVATLDGHADLVRSLAFSPDGKQLAAAGGLPQRSGEIKIWDVATRQLVKTIEGHTDCIYSVAWSPNGPNEKMLATGSYD